MAGLELTLISPADLLDGARTIQSKHVHRCDWLPKWIAAETFLQWARRGLQENDDYGLSNAIAYAKKAAACRLDSLLRNYHLTAFSHAKYPQKIEALGTIGLSIPGVVYDLVIEPRNQLEHFYQFPRRDGAGHAVEIAGLFISATDAEARQSSIVAVGWNALGGSFINNLSERVEFRGFSDHPMLFLDVFENPAVAKIVDPKSHEIRWAALSSFTREEALELAKLLRRVGEGSSAQMSEFFFREIKRQGCF